METIQKTVQEEKRDRVILVGLSAARLKREDNADEWSMEELAALTETAGGEVVAQVLQNKDAPDPRTFIGEGKVAEVQTLIENERAEMVIFDNDLSPSQMRVLTDAFGVQVLDRSGLILDIFAKRAKTKEGRLQVELAQYQYLLPRLTGMWSHLVRQTASGGKSPIGTRGPGEDPAGNGPPPHPPQDRQAARRPGRGAPGAQYPAADAHEKRNSRGGPSWATPTRGNPPCSMP